MKTLRLPLLFSLSDSNTAIKDMLVIFHKMINNKSTQKTNNSKINLIEIVKENSIV